MFLRVGRAQEWVLGRGSQREDPAAEWAGARGAAHPPAPAGTEQREERSSWKRWEAVSRLIH